MQEAFVRTYHTRSRVGRSNGDYLNVARRHVSTIIVRFSYSVECCRGYIVVVNAFIEIRIRGEDLFFPSRPPARIALNVSLSVYEFTYLFQNKFVVHKLTKVYLQMCTTSGFKL